MKLAEAQDESGLEALLAGDFLIGNKIEMSKQGRRQNDKHQAAHDVRFFFQADLLRAGPSPPKDTRTDLGAVCLVTPDKTMIKDRYPPAACRVPVTQLAAKYKTRGPPPRGLDLAHRG